MENSKQTNETSETSKADEKFKSVSKSFEAQAETSSIESVGQPSCFQKIEQNAQNAKRLTSKQRQASQRSAKMVWRSNLVAMEKCEIEKHFKQTPQKRLSGELITYMAIASVDRMLQARYVSAKPCFVVQEINAGILEQTFRMVLAKAAPMIWSHNDKWSLLRLPISLKSIGDTAQTGETMCQVLNAEDGATVKVCCKNLFQQLLTVSKTSPIKQDVQSPSFSIEPLDHSKFQPDSELFSQATSISDGNSTVPSGVDIAAIESDNIPLIEKREDKITSPLKPNLVEKMDKLPQAKVTIAISDRNTLLSTEQLPAQYNALMPDFAENYENVEANFYRLMNILNSVSYLHNNDRPVCFVCGYFGEHYCPSFQDH